MPLNLPGQELIVNRKGRNVICYLYTDFLYYTCGCCLFQITRELGYRRIYCFYAYHVNKMLKMTKFEETRSLLTHVVSGLCSRLDEEELLVSAATQKTRKFIP